MKEVNLFLLKSTTFFTLFLLSAFILEDKIFATVDEYPGLEIFNDKNNASIVLLGDSTFFTTGTNESDTRSTSTMLQQYHNGTQIHTFAHAAYHLGVYEALVGALCHSDYRPKIVIVPINLRSFSPVWDTRPEYQFYQEIQTIRRHGDTLNLLGIRLYYLFRLNTEELSREKILWLKQPIYFDSKQIGTVQDFNYVINENTTDFFPLMRKKFIYNYNYPLNRSHRKISSLLQIIDESRECNITTIFYLVPIDYQMGQVFAGPEFISSVQSNKEVIMRACSEKNATVIDMSFDLPSEDFTYPYIPDEHLNQFGRMYTAHRLADCISDIYTPS
jgi:hypothetical protein